MSKIMAIANEKGGVGKTSTTFNIGCAMARRGYNVLLADLDGQANLTMLAGVDNPSALEKTVCELLADVANDALEKCGDPAEFVKGYVMEAGIVDVLPSKERLADVSAAMVSMIDRERLLKTALNPLSEVYDYILLDCKPSVDVMTVNALAAADGVIIPTNAESLSIKGVETLLGHLRKVKRNINPGIKIEGILVTMLQGRRRGAVGQNPRVQLIVRLMGYCRVGERVMFTICTMIRDEQDYLGEWLVYHLDGNLGIRLRKKPPCTAARRLKI